MRKPPGQKPLTQKERLFCRIYAGCFNPKEAAIKAGFQKTTAEATGLKLIERRDIVKYIEKIIKDREAFAYAVKSGLERIAFGSVADAIKLVFVKENIDPNSLDKMDFFNIAEIKKKENNTMEIKFFDRTKALEKLLQLTGGSRSKDLEPLYKALEDSAKLLNEKSEKSEN